jgi:site-specific DNA recombinase
MPLTRERTFAIIYASMSTADQGKGVSILPQAEACPQLATRAGSRVPERDGWVDEGISGTTLDRPGWHRVRELVQAQAMAAVIGIDPARLSHHGGHPLLLAEALEQAGVQWLIVSHPLERGPEGWLCVHLRGALAEDARATRVARTQRGRMGGPRRGLHGARCPVGYRAIRAPHGGRWEVDPEEAALVRRRLAMCLHGLPTREMARPLTLERVPTTLEREPKRGRRRALGAGCWSPPLGTRGSAMRGPSDARMGGSASA